ncbi:MAG: DUF177 domain-containing protein [Pseudoruegeria sp.]
MTAQNPVSPTLELTFTVSELPQKKSTRFKLTPDAPVLEALRQELKLSGLRKVRFEGALTPRGKSDWQLSAKLGATVVQPCIVSLEPVTTRIDEPVERYYSKDLADEFPEEMEMPDGDNIELLGTTFDIGAILTEALSLSLPLYPRAKESDTISHVFTEPGKTPMTDEDTRPFAGLASLRDSLKKDSE